MKKAIIFIDYGVCSSWGRILPKHLFKTQYAPKIGHRYCLNCGLTIGEVRKEERFNKQGGTIENRVIDFHSKDLKNPIFLTKEDLKIQNYRVFI
jgi:hypothetical protein